MSPTLRLLAITTLALVPITHDQYTDPLNVDPKLTLGEGEPDETGDDTRRDEGPEAQEEDTEADGDADAEMPRLGTGRDNHDDERLWGVDLVLIS